MINTLVNIYYIIGKLGVLSCFAWTVMCWQVVITPSLDKILVVKMAGSGDPEQYIKGR
jgi:hypothetical protein